MAGHENNPKVNSNAMWFNFYSPRKCPLFDTNIDMRGKKLDMKRADDL